MEPLDLFAEDLDYRATSVRHSRMALSNNAVRSRIRAIYAALKPTMDALPSQARLSSWSYGKDLTVILHLRDLERFNGPEAVSLLERIVNDGGYASEDTRDNASDVTRRYSFHYAIPHPDLGHVHVQLTVQLGVKTDSAVCYRVQVGSKSVETPQYEIVCPEPTAVTE